MEEIKLELSADFLNNLGYYRSFCIFAFYSWTNDENEPNLLSMCLINLGLNILLKDGDSSSDTFRSNSNVFIIWEVSFF